MWVRKTKAPHRCKMPDRDGKWLGSIWRCRCGQLWQIYEVNGSWTGWTRTNPKRKRSK